MFSAMCMLDDGYGNRMYRNARVGGYKREKSAINAIIRKSPTKTGCIQIGQRVVAIVVKGIVTHA